MRKIIPYKSHLIVYAKGLRQKKLESLGVKFLRFDDIDIKRNMSWVLEEVLNAIENNRPTPNPSKEGN